MKILILSVSLGLLLGFVERPAWGQPQGQETVKVPGHEPSVKPPAAAPDIPVDDFDRGTPRRAVAGFLKAAREDDYRRAAEYLDLRSFGLPADKAKTLGAELARHLKIVLDQKLPIDIDALGLTILIRSASNGGCSTQTRTPEALMSSISPVPCLMSCSDSSKYSISIVSDTVSRDSARLSAPSHLPI